MYIAVTIDTECDRSVNWMTSSPVSFDGVTKAIPKILQPLFSNLGIKPVYFLSHEVMENAESLDVLKRINDSELGTHLHGDFIGPSIKNQRFDGALCDEMQAEYSYETEREKMVTLTNLFIKCIGYGPTSFRAGRFGASVYTGKILEELNYLVDSSVTPGVKWLSSNLGIAVDYTNVDCYPFWIEKNGSIFQKGSSRLLEVPITIVNKRHYLFWKTQYWFRPSYSDYDEMKAIIDMSIKSNSDKKSSILVMMFHNVELVPGASPYVHNKKELAEYVNRLTRILDYAVNSAKLIPITLKDFYYKFKEVNE